MFCTKCGAALNANVNFCNFCGNAFMRPDNFGLHESGKKDSLLKVAIKAAIAAVLLAIVIGLVLYIITPLIFPSQVENESLTHTFTPLVMQSLKENLKAGR